MPPLSGGSVSRSSDAVAPSSPVVSVSNTNAFCSDPSFVDVAIRFLRDGTIDVQDNCSGFTYDQDYVTSGLPDATIGDDYEVMVTNTGGGTPPTGGPGLGIWLTINVSRTFDFSDIAAFENGTWTFQIREIADTGNTDTAEFDWDTEDGS